MTSAVSGSGTFRRNADEYKTPPSPLHVELYYVPDKPGHIRFEAVCQGFLGMGGSFTVALHDLGNKLDRGHLT
jgi:hypothetical protein